MNETLQDLAWAVLPKEFREEVKRLYNIANKDIDELKVAYKLEYLFGRHNLTSDAEGEPKPAESKFHVGQKVRFKGKDIGFEITAVEKWDDCHEYKYKLAGWKHSYRESDLGPYTEPEESTCTDACSSQCKSQDFDNSFSKERRLTIAAMMMQGLLANPNNNANLSENVADALNCADALIAECEKGGSDGN